MQITERIQQLAGLLILLVLPLSTGCFSMTGAAVGGTIGGGVGLVSGTVSGAPGEGFRDGCSAGLMAGMLVGGEVDMAILAPLDDWREAPETDIALNQPSSEPALAINDVVRMRNEGTPPFRVVEEIERRGTSEPLSDPALRHLAAHQIEIEIIEAMHANFRQSSPPKAAPATFASEPRPNTVSRSVSYLPPSLPYSH